MFLGLPGRAAVFWLIVVAAAAGVLGVSWIGRPANLTLALPALVFIAIAAAAELFTVSLPSSRPGAQHNLSVSGAVFVAVVLLFRHMLAVPHPIARRRLLGLTSAPAEAESTRNRAAAFRYSIGA